MIFILNDLPSIPCDIFTNQPPMHPDTTQLLLELNQRFYQDFGRAFAATRRRVQPGMQRAAETPAPGRELAGSGLRLGRAGALPGAARLQRALPGIGRFGRTAGRSRAGPAPQPGFQRSLPPGRPGRAGLDRGLDAGRLAGDLVLRRAAPPAGDRAARAAAAPGAPAAGAEGRFVHSVWQFQHSPRLAARVQPWERVGLSAAEVEPGDTLLDWRYALPGPGGAGRAALRAPVFSGPSWRNWPKTAALRILDEYESDGAGGRLGLYQIWQGNKSG